MIKIISSLTVVLMIALYCNIDGVDSLNCVTCSACTMPWTNATDPISTCVTGNRVNI